MTVTVKDTEQLADFAREFVQKISPAIDSATLITLSGELGAGKTAFTKVLAKVLGVEDVVNSPTFVLEKIYELPSNESFKRLVHIDAYRLTAGVELAPLGFDNIMADSGNLVLLEWPEKVQDALPVPTHNLSFTVVSPTERTISYD